MPSMFVFGRLDCGIPAAQQGGKVNCNVRPGLLLLGEQRQDRGLDTNIGGQLGQTMIQVFTSVRTPVSFPPVNEASYHRCLWAVRQAGSGGGFLGKVSISAQSLTWHEVHINTFKYQLRVTLQWTIKEQFYRLENIKCSIVFCVQGSISNLLQCFIKVSVCCCENSMMTRVRSNMITKTLDEVYCQSIIELKGQLIL